MREALDQVERTLGAPQQFDPATSMRRFSIAISAQSILALAGCCGGCTNWRPECGSTPGRSRLALRESGHGLLGYDVLIAPAGFRGDGDPDVIVRDRLVYVADPANPRLLPAGPPHRRGSGRGAPRDRPAPAGRPGHRALAGLGVTPNVVVTTGGWLPLAFLVAGTDFVAAVPERLARRVSGAAGVTVIEPPFGTIELVEAAWWHPMHTTDPALTWLRGIIGEVRWRYGRAPGSAPARPARRAGSSRRRRGQDRSRPWRARQGSSRC